MDKYELIPIANYQPTLLEPTAISAAVLVLLITSFHQETRILLMQRPDHFSSYPGDICFPGGMKETYDIGLKATALRETHEETGIALNPDLIIGQLNDFHDRYGNIVRPFVAQIDSCELEKNPPAISSEVKQFIFLPISELNHIAIDDNNVKPTRRKPNYILPIRNNYIWGLTASILVHLSNIIFNEQKGVAFN